jgi:hypothetical protein
MAEVGIFGAFFFASVSFGQAKEMKSNRRKKMCIKGSYSLGNGRRNFSK